MIADGTAGHSAERGGAAEQKAQPQGRAREDGPATDEGSKRTAAGEEREAMKKSSEGRASLALGREGRRWAHGAEKSQKGGAPGGRAARK